MILASNSNICLIRRHLLLSYIRPIAFVNNRGSTADRRYPVTGDNKKGTREKRSSFAIFSATVLSYLVEGDNDPTLFPLMIVDFKATLGIQ
ncbi:MAG: hypothetical protein AB4352_00690 [Hormoscilla sp.]